MDGWRYTGNRLHPTQKPVGVLAPQVRHLLAGLPLDREVVVRRVHLEHPDVLTRFEAERLTAFRIADHIAGFVLRGPLSVRAGEVLTRDQHAHTDDSRYKRGSG